MRRHCQSVTMIVTTKATRITSWTASSASILCAAPSRGRKERRSPPGERRPFVDSRDLELGEVVADVAEDVLDLTPQEEHRDDHGNGDDCDNEGILDQALTVVFAEEALNTHGNPPFCAKRGRLSLCSQVGKRY